MRPPCRRVTDRWCQSERGVKWKESREEVEMAGNGRGSTCRGARRSGGRLAVLEGRSGSPGRCRKISFAFLLVEAAATAAAPVVTPPNTPQVEQMSRRRAGKTVPQTLGCQLER